jgi:hypothetical protein
VSGAREINCLCRSARGSVIDATVAIARIVTRHNTNASSRYAFGICVRFAAGWVRMGSARLAIYDRAKGRALVQYFLENL